MEEYIFKCKDQEGLIWYTEQMAENLETAKEIIIYKYRNIAYIEILSSWIREKE